jgi:ferredoxin
MNLQQILGAAFSIGAVGAGFGLLLSLASRLFAARKAEPANEPAAVPADAPHLTAVVHCSGGIHAEKKYRYEGLTDCVSGMNLGDGAILCPYGCLGLGTCVASCPRGAISLRDGAAAVDQDRCTGCFDCVSACPRNIIQPVPYVQSILIPCLSHAKGAVSRTLCNIGCLGCRLCLKSCRFGAISISDNLALIDYDKCTGCGDCAEKCPRRLIVDLQLGKHNLPRMEDSL